MSDRIVALSDTHGFHRKVTVPDGDIVIFAGDAMTSGYDFKEFKDFAEWFSDLPHMHKIFCGGNHDRVLESSERICLSYFTKKRSSRDVIYLKDDGASINGKIFWGSPYQPEFYNWAFNVPRGEQIKKHWDLIPLNTDVLITHGPPMGILDQTEGWGNQHVGCEELLKRLGEVKPKIHIFGHIHAGYGVHYNSDTMSANVSICNEAYVAVNEPQVFDL